VDGFTGTYILGDAKTDAQVIWERCRNAWVKYGIITQMPKALSEKRVITREIDAIWALDRLTIAMTAQRIQLTVGYEVGGLWVIGEHVALTLPHQTNGETVECVVEKITASKHNNRVTMTLVILDEITTNLYSSTLRQNSYEDITMIGDRQNVYDGTPDRGNIQNAYD
jgi:uncharacterized protein YejL (UPF0352 family)